MLQQYEAIRLLGEVLKQYEVVGADGVVRDEIASLNQINVFVGPNNTGKSRFLRGLYAAEPYQYRPTGFDLDKITTRLRELHGRIRGTFVPYKLTEVGSLRRDELVHFLELRHFGTNGETTFNELHKRLAKISQAQPSQSMSFEGYGNVHSSQLVLGFEAIRALAKEILAEIETLRCEVGEERRVYIPILRGLRPFKHVSGDNYKDRTIQDYGLVSSEDRVVFTGLGLFHTLLEHKNGPPEKRKIIEDYEEFLKNELFDGRQVELTPLHGADTVHVMIGDDDEFPVYKLGDGVQALIILTFLAFINERRTLFLIEEPDLYLHPGMQRKWLELLVRHPRFAKHQFFLTTHSNHILDMSSDYPGVSVFLFRKESEKKKFTVRPASFRDRNVLHEIGARSTSVFLTNGSIWVEGITDRLYIREFLQKYLSEQGEANILREDTHFSLIEYGGGNLVHFDFREVAEDLSEKINTIRLCSNSFLVMDGDNVKKGSRVPELKEQLGDRMLVFDSKEIENLLDPVVIAAAANEILARSNVEPASKRSLLSETFKVSEYHGTKKKLGEYLDSKYGVKYFAADSGTIKMKMEFCRVAIRYMQENPSSWQLTREARNLCEKLAAFIREVNS